MSEDQPNNPLHGVTLKAILEDLLERHGWEELAARVHIRCFEVDPSVQSSLKFLRKTDWARAKVERIYVADHARIEKRKKRNARRAAMRAHRAEVESAAEAPVDEGADSSLADDGDARSPSGS